jgi:hypothetical protein
MSDISLLSAQTSVRAGPPGGLQSGVAVSLPLPSAHNRTPRRSLRNPINHSILRPLVPAPDRFLYWFTPFALDRLNDLEKSFPHDVIVKNRIVMAQCVAPETLSNYAAGLIRFTKFCDDFSVNELDRMPASENLLSLFVSTTGAGNVGRSAIHTWVESLELWHRLNGAPWQVGKLFVARSKVRPDLPRSRLTVHFASPSRIITCSLFAVVSISQMPLTSLCLQWLP